MIRKFSSHYIERLRTNFNRGKERAWTPEYTAIKNRTSKLTKKIDQETNLAGVYGGEEA